MTVIGIDPSFTATGISNGTEHMTFPAPKAAENEERAAATRRRCAALADALTSWIIVHAPTDVRALHIFIEAPMLHADAGNPYDMGWLMCMLDARLRAVGVTQIVEVPSATLRKFIGLPGNAAKIEVPVRLLRRFGVEFAGDRGADKAFAYLLHRYGSAVVRGEVVHVPTLALARGKGAAKKRAARAKAA
jgi:hypothetical protein